MSRIALISLFSALPLVACGGGTPDPEGPHHPYVVSEVNVPTSNMESTQYGLDLNGDKTADNQLGAVLAALSGYFNVQDTLKKAVDQGDIIILLDLQTKSYSSSGGTGLAVKLGDTATVMPTPCASATDTVCRRHLDGSGVFTIDAASPENAAVAGKIVGGTFNGGPGDIALQIALGSTAGVTLDLIGARAKASGMSDTGIDSVILAGALTEDDLNTQVLPAIHAQLTPLIKETCMGTAPPDCGCPTAGSTGKTILGLFDTTPKDCNVTVEEIANNTLIKSLLAPDVTIDGKAALSLGVKVKAVKATFPTPAE